MVFASIGFLFFFLPALLLCYFIIPQRFRGARNIVLLLFSLFFYAWGGPRLLGLILASIVIFYLAGLMVDPKNSTALRKFGVCFAVLGGVGLLGWFKYAMFVAENLSLLFPNLPVPYVVLPIGISFYTFQGLSYVLDVYWGTVPRQKNPLWVTLYIALFPQLVAGPIVRYETIALEIEHRKENLADFSAGFTRILFGLGKKMLIANPMGLIADAIFAHNPELLSAPVAWVGALAFAFQIYFDFSAYSDMAIGLGKLFGFHFLENFNYPYVARSITDFWRRWHISLSTWFRDYVYIPLGGSRRGRGKLFRNLFIVWLLTGIWHGAAWNFVLWGLLFFVLLIGEKLLWGKALEKIPFVFGWAYTMFFVLISWVLFRAEDMGLAVSYLGALFGQGSGEFSHVMYYFRQHWIEWIAVCLAMFPITRLLQKALTRREETSPLCGIVLAYGPKFIALGLFFLSYMRLVTGAFNPFIYFRF